MCKTPVIHMFHTYNTSVYPKHVLYLQKYICNTGVHPTHVLDV